MDNAMYKTILNQLSDSPNGMRRLRVMAGAADFTLLVDGIQFRFWLSSKNKANHVRITENAKGTYDVKFYLLRREKELSRGEFKNIPADGLYGLFIEQTGIKLAFSANKR